MAVHLGLWLLLHVPSFFGLTPHQVMVEGGLRTGSLILAYSLALAINLEVSGEYRSTPWLKFAWLALAGNAAFSIARILVESQLLMLVWPGYLNSPLAGLLQHLAIVPANLLLVLGLLAMWGSYNRLDLGFTIKPVDYVLIAGTLALMGSLLFFREGLSEARSPYLSARLLQQSGLVLLSLAAAVSLVLHRIAVQMGGGKLALTLRFLVLYTLTRAVLVLTQALLRLMSPEYNDPLSSVSLLLDVCWQSVPWLAALAAAYRAELTQHAVRELIQYRASRAEALAGGM